MAKRICLDLQIWNDGRQSTFTFDTGSTNPICVDAGWISNDDMAFVVKVLEIIKETGLKEEHSVGACLMPEGDSELNDEPQSIGVVYFIRANGAGLVKIGYSTNHQKRLSNLQTSCPHELQLIGVASGDQQKESSIHKKFAHLRMTGEWFRLTQELFDFIKEETGAE